MASTTTSLRPTTDNWFHSDWQASGLLLSFVIALPIAGFCVTAGVYFIFKTLCTGKNRTEQQKNDVSDSYQNMRQPVWNQDYEYEAPPAVIVQQYPLAYQHYRMPSIQQDMQNYEKEQELLICHLREQQLQQEQINQINMVQLQWQQMQQSYLAEIQAKEGAELYEMFLDQQRKSQAAESRAQALENSAFIESEARKQAEREMKKMAAKKAEGDRQKLLDKLKEIDVNYGESMFEAPVSSKKNTMIREEKSSTGVGSFYSNTDNKKMEVEVDNKPSAGEDENVVEKLSTIKYPTVNLTSHPPHADSSNPRMEYSSIPPRRVLHKIYSQFSGSKKGLVVSSMEKIKAEHPDTHIQQSADPSHNNEGPVYQGLVQEDEKRKTLANLREDVKEPADEISSTRDSKFKDRKIPQLPAAKSTVTAKRKGLTYQDMGPVYQGFVEEDEKRKTLADLRDDVKEPADEIPSTRDSRFKDRKNPQLPTAKSTVTAKRKGPSDNSEGPVYQGLVKEDEKRKTLANLKEDVKEPADEIPSTRDSRFKDYKNPQLPTAKSTVTAKRKGITYQDVGPVYQGFVEEDENLDIEANYEGLLNDEYQQAVRASMDIYQGFVDSTGAENVYQGIAQDKVEYMGVQRVDSGRVYGKLAEVDQTLKLPPQKKPLPRMAHPRMAHPRMAHPRMAHPRMAHPRMAHPRTAPTKITPPKTAHPEKAMHAKPGRTAYDQEAVYFDSLYFGSSQGKAD